MPYAEGGKRRVVFNKAAAVAEAVNPRNVIVQWEEPRVNIRQEVKYLGVIRANPKIIIGYSDITALLVAITKLSNVITYHGPVAQRMQSMSGLSTNSMNSAALSESGAER